MPRKPNQPEIYTAKYGVEAMKVAQPFKSVAEWCGGSIIKDGVKFLYVLIEGSGEQQRAPEGSYIVRVFPDKDEFVVWPKRRFESMYQKFVSKND